MLPLSTWLQYRQAVSPAFVCLLIATIAYLVGAMGGAVLGNIPLNNALDNFSIPTATAAEIATQRKNFETPWSMLHFIRTLASIASLILVIAACLVDNFARTK